MEDVLRQIGDLGFPIILSMYLLVRIEGKMEQLTVSIRQLSSVLEREEQKPYKEVGYISQS